MFHVSCTNMNKQKVPGLFVFTDRMAENKLTSQEQQAALKWKICQLLSSGKQTLI